MHKTPHFYLKIQKHLSSGHSTVDPRALFGQLALCLWDIYIKKLRGICFGHCCKINSSERHQFKLMIINANSDTPTPNVIHARAKKAFCSDIFLLCCSRCVLYCLF